LNPEVCDLDMVINHITLPTPVGDLWVGATEKGLFYINFGGLDTPALESVYGERSGVVFLVGGGLADTAARQLNEYFTGRRRAFSIPLDLRGTSGFMKKVWKATRKVPYGEVRSYGWIAEKIREPYSARAVGRAMALNPIPIVIPCHRVVASDGSLGGYGGGLSRKRWLLAHEAGQTRLGLGLLEEEEGGAGGR
jgi:methylated-DNA-[protein]-cysteine S-methyltransferase